MFKNQVVLSVAVLALLTVVSNSPALASGAVVGKAKGLDPTLNLTIPREKTFQQKNKTERVQAKEVFNPTTGKVKIVDPPMIVMPD